MNTELWFAETVEDGLVAGAICGSCPIKLLCLEWAVTHHEAGIWGGRAHDLSQKVESSLSGRCKRGHKFDGFELRKNGRTSRTCSECKSQRGGRKARDTGHTSPEEVDRRRREIRRLMDLGLTKMEMSKELDLHHRTIQRYMKRLGAEVAA